MAQAPKLISEIFQLVRPSKRYFTLDRSPRATLKDFPRSIAQRYYNRRARISESNPEQPQIPMVAADRIFIRQDANG